MSENAIIGARELPCLHCGYDLRATAVAGGGIRCPECGKISAAGGDSGASASRIPWVQRRWRGRGRMFIATVWLVIMRPKRFAADLQVRGRQRDGRRFRLICEVIATVVMAGAMVISLKQWDRLPVVGTAFSSLALTPAVVLLDRWYGEALILVGAFPACRLCVEFYRGILSLGGGPGVRGVPHYLGMRLTALGQYGAALIMVESWLIGIAWLLAAAWHNDRSRHPDMLERDLMLIVVGVAYGLFLWASLGVVMRTGRWRGLRLGLMLLYPVMAAIVWLEVAGVITWAIGFVVFGVRSMTV